MWVRAGDKVSFSTMLFAQLAAYSLILFSSASVNVHLGLGLCVFCNFTFLNDACSIRLSVNFS